MIRMNFLLQGLIAFSLLSTSVFAKSDRICPEDPYASPSTDMCNPMRYIPNKGINIAAAVLYFLVAAILTFHSFRQKANYFLALVIGAWCEGIGLALRIAFRTNPHSTGLYIVCYLFVVLSPCAFLAGDYILLGRLVQYLDAHHYLRPLRAQLVSWIFIISDVITFLIQAAGGGLSTATDVQTAQNGGHIFLAGIAAQLASFVFFTITCLIFGIRAWREDKELWQRPGWKPLFFALGFTCICFLIRSVYRTVELSQGYVGYLAIHERYFLGLDCLPLLLGIATYVFFWPGRYLHFAPKPKKPKKSKKSKNGVADDVEEGLPMRDLNADGLGDMVKGDENYQVR
ncbi:integral membrane protein [Cryptococcus neoformans]|nr:integral membrane protein [Cryptococcus neoformans var. grubii Bt1]OWZ64841.1 hypothetical protein AYX15_03543 [Cryptococcus neoformans var. grubii]OWZ75308.1 integral membrane protein [Cryptococcus neoformans var. grubii Bt85]OXG12214.1 integral membrane protein [Cryptococcus neoformans var. grubii Tu401-1]OXG15116.1 integral membrane protein [Cryptococcus neoformans var. grubii Ze90-1]OXM76458.1 integral membrane protein [Cryptococcus neoformans var. grubii Bt63]